MHKLIFVILILALGMCGCAQKEYRQVSMEEIAQTYEDAGYEVACKTYDRPAEDGATGYLQAETEDEEYIYFRFFANEEDAEAYTDTMDHPGILFGFSVLFGDATWQTVKTCGTISITYFDSEDYKPFEMLLDKS